MHVAHLAVTTKRSRVVETGAVETEGRVFCALIYVLAVVAVARESSITDTPGLLEKIIYL